MRTDWTDLPDMFVTAMEAEAGSVITVDPAPTGNHADIASTIQTIDGQVFVKAARKVSPDQDGPEVRSLRGEAAINPYVSEHAPRLLWTVEAGGWFALGFEHIDARHADYSPGSADLGLLSKVIAALQGMTCPDAVVRRVEQRWTPVLDDVSPMAGNTLLHADLNPANLLITSSGRAYVVDWAFTSRGAAWIELGLLIPWLLRAGHSPSETARWIAQFPSWTDADPTALDRFAWAFAETWRRRCAADPSTAWMAELAALTQRWADYWIE